MSSDDFDLKNTIIIRFERLINDLEKTDNPNLENDFNQFFKMLDDERQKQKAEIIPSLYQELALKAIQESKENDNNLEARNDLKLLISISKKSRNLGVAVDYFTVVSTIVNEFRKNKPIQEQSTDKNEEKKSIIDENQLKDFFNNFFYSKNENNKSFLSKLADEIKSLDEEDEQLLQKNDEVETLKGDVQEFLKKAESFLSIGKSSSIEKDETLKSWLNIPNKENLDPIIYKIVIDAFNENIENNIIKGRYYRYILVLMDLLKNNDLCDSIVKFHSIYELGESIKIEEYKDLSLLLNRNIEQINQSIEEQNLQELLKKLYVLYTEINNKNFISELEDAYDKVIVNESEKMERIVQMFEKTLDDKIQNINESLEIKVKSFDDLHKEYADDLKRTLKKELQEVNKEIEIKISSDDKITIKDLNEKLIQGFQITEQDKSYIDSAKKAFKNYQKTMLLAVILPITVALASILTGAYVLQTAYSNKGNSLGEDQIIVNKTRAEALENEKTLFKLFLNSKEKDYNKFKEKFLQENQGNFPHFKDLNSEEVIEK
ncbi:hypothetical protein ACQ1Q5_00020 [Ornithobacterium rhinotracheale]